MYARYTERVKVHADRYGPRKSGRNRLIVIHTSEGGEGPTAAANLAHYQTLPGDRPGTSGPYGSSYQYVTDTDLTAIPCTPDDVVSYSSAGANHDGIHICLPGKAAQTRAQWLDLVSREYIDTCAAIMLDVAAAHQIPLVRLSVAQVRTGVTAGYCSHHDVSLAFERSTHTDPGPFFPWDELAVAIQHLGSLTIGGSVDYFILKSQPSTLWASSDGLTAVRLEGHQAQARGDVPAVPRVMPESEAARYVFVNGLPSISVK